MWYGKVLCLGQCVAYKGENITTRMDRENYLKQNEHIL